MADRAKPLEVPWYSPGYVASMQGTGCAPKPPEHVWTLVKAGRRLDATFQFGGETYGWELQFFDGGELILGSRFPLKAGAQAEAESLREQHLRDGWIAQ